MNVGVLEAKNRLSELIAAARRGEEVLITNRGEPAVRLVPVSGSAERKARALKALDEMGRIADQIRKRNGGEGFSWQEISAARAAGRR